MEGERKQNDTTCRGGCGFFGSSATNGLCSLCYKQQLTKMNAAPASSASGPNTSSQLLSASVAPSITKTEEERGSSSSSICSKDLFESGPSGLGLIGKEKEALTVVGTKVKMEDVVVESSGLSPKEEKEETPPQDKKSKTNRCATCRKKVGLLGFECRCGGLFCGIHRYSDKHECSFDYREYGKSEIQKNNPVVVAEKIKKL